MNNLEIQKNEITEISTNLENSEKVISKEITNGYLFGNSTYSLWEEIIETNELDYEKLEPIYNFHAEERCSDSSIHRSVAYQDENGAWKDNCCIKPKKVKYYKRKNVYYLTDYHPNKVKVKFLYLPINNDSIDFSQLSPVSNRDDWKKQLYWLVERLINRQLIFGSKEVEDKKIKNDFFQEYNNLARE